MDETNSGAAARSARNIRIDGLRFIAASFVIFIHSTYAFNAGISKTTSDVLLSWFGHGEWGVALFLVLSGFLFGRIAFEDPTREILYGKFIQNRALRILPLLLLVLFMGTSIYRNKLDGAFWLSALTLSFESESIRMYDVFGPLWTVGVELKFYLIFPLLVRTFGARLRMWLGALAVIIVVRTITIYGIDPSWEVYNYGVLGRFDQIFMGVILALVFDRLTKLGGRVLPAIGLVLGIAEMTWVFLHVDPWLTPHNHLYEALYPSLEALGCVTILFSVVTFPASFGPLERLFGTMGQWSYSMYLLHFAVLRVVAVDVEHVFVADDPQRNGLVKTLVCALPAVTLLSALTYTIVEEPFLRMRVVYLRKKAGADGAPATEPRATEQHRQEALDARALSADTRIS